MSLLPLCPWDPEDVSVPHACVPRDNKSLHVLYDEWANEDPDMSNIDLNFAFSGFPAETDDPSEGASSNTRAVPDIIAEVSCRPTKRKKSTYATAKQVQLLIRHDPMNVDVPTGTHENLARMGTRVRVPAQCAEFHVDLFSQPFCVRAFKFEDGIWLYSLSDVLELLVLDLSAKSTRQGRKMTVYRAAMYGMEPELRASVKMALWPKCGGRFLALGDFGLVCRVLGVSDLVMCDKFNRWAGPEALHRLQAFLSVDANAELIQ